MANTSATGGFLSPAASPAPLEGQALLDFMQGVIVGVTGLPGTMVRPVWQAEPPNVPDAVVCWCAFRIGARPSDTFPYVHHNADGQGSDTLQRHERLTVLCSFYDIGSGGAADGYLAILRDGLSIPQNRETLQANGFAFVGAGEPVPLPSLLKQRWLYRVDVELTFARQIDRTYPVLTITSAQGTLVTDDGLTRPIAVE